MQEMKKMRKRKMKMKMNKYHLAYVFLNCTCTSCIPSTVVMNYSQSLYIVSVALVHSLCIPDMFPETLYVNTLHSPSKVCVGSLHSPDQLLINSSHTPYISLTLCELLTQSFRSLYELF
jgi:hypothetical protein